jgi:hypothetical protein
MNLLVCMLLLASPTGVELLDETPTIAAGKWNYYPVSLRQQPARVDATFEVLSGHDDVRLALLTHTDAQRLFRDMPHGVLAVTPLGRHGSLRFRVPRPDDYDIVVDNREGARDVTVRVRVSLEFGAPEPVAVTASRPRQLTVVALSFMFFFGVVTYSARRILRAIGRG